MTIWPRYPLLGFLDLAITGIASTDVTQWLVIVVHVVADAQHKTHHTVRVKNFTSGDVIAERLSVKHIIVQVRCALVGFLSEVVLVCLSVMGLRLKYTGLCIVYVSCSMCPLFFMLALVMEDSLEDRRWRQARERMQIYSKWLSAQQRDERRQYKSERRRLECQHPTRLTSLDDPAWTG